MVLSDLEICKKLAELEGIDFSSSRLGVLQYFKVGDMGKETKKYNPITDWSILGPLMVKYKVEVDYTCMDVSIYLKDYTVPVSVRTFDNEEGIPEAICLCILEANRLL